MRDIKFRAWVYGEQWYTMEEVEEVFGPISQHLNNPELIWCQYTGLKDKNGTEIYEGDILSADETQRPFDVFWATNAGGFMSRNSYVQVFDYPRYEVVGNIYENPEQFDKI